MFSRFTLCRGESIALVHRTHRLVCACRNSFTVGCRWLHLTAAIFPLITWRSKDPVVRILPAGYRKSASGIEGNAQSYVSLSHSRLICRNRISDAKIISRSGQRCLSEVNNSQNHNTLSSEDKARLDRIRNIGISAHIDCGKTTLTERILYYTGKIKEMHEVKGKDKVGAKMDSMELEREKGITIKSAATYTEWKGTNINIIDTPGHADFTFEVERALRVLDSAVLVLCAVGGVQSQTVTVNNQMSRYNIPRICFINKLDRMGADYERAVSELRTKLRLVPVLLQIPVITDNEFECVIDLMKMKSIYNAGPNGETIIEKDIPHNYVEEAQKKRKLLIETLADNDDELADMFLSDREPSEASIKRAIRRCTIARKVIPVVMGSAYHNKGVQLLLDAVCDYAPSPHDIDNYAMDVLNDKQKVMLTPSATSEFVGLAFKLEEGLHGQLTYVRVYQGSMGRGQSLLNVRSGKKVRVGRLARIHSDEMVDIQSVGPGEICAGVGIECSSGDTLTSGPMITMSSIHVPPSVVSFALHAEQKQISKLMKALTRFQREDLTFHVEFDEETREINIFGMGELHLEIYIERIKREYGVKCVVGKPQVAFKETTLVRSHFDYLHKKQSGGAGQYARVVGYIEHIPMDSTQDGRVESLEFVDKVYGNAIPPEFIQSVKKGFLNACKSSHIAGYKVSNVRFVLCDGKTHPVDSSDMAFSYAAAQAFRKAFTVENVTFLEPMMKVCFTALLEYQSDICMLIDKRSGEIDKMSYYGPYVDIYSFIGLRNMFGVHKDLSSLTKGSASFTVEYKCHSITSNEVKEEILKARESRSKSH